MHLLTPDLVAISMINQALPDRDPRTVGTRQHVFTDSRLSYFLCLVCFFIPTVSNLYHAALVYHVYLYAVNEILLLLPAYLVYPRQLCFTQTTKNMMQNASEGI